MLRSLLDCPVSSSREAARLEETKMISRYLITAMGGDHGWRHRLSQAVSSAIRATSVLLPGRRVDCEDAVHTPLRGT